MKSFAGFSSNDKRTVTLPPEFFTDLLPAIDDLAELKVTLYAFWFTSRQEGRIKFVRFTDFLKDGMLAASMADTDHTCPEAMHDALERAVQRGTLLVSEPADGWGERTVFFINNKEGRAAQDAVSNGAWDPSQTGSQEISLETQRPNIFLLYEQHIGVLTPLISDMLRDAERQYPPAWIEDAFKAAVKSNVRRWNYVEAILKRWHEEGRSEEDRRSDKSGRKKYIQGPFGDIIEH